VLSPLTRIELRLDFFKDRVYLRALPLDLQLQIGRRVKEVVRDRVARLQLERVVVQVRRNVPSWRYPETSSGLRKLEDVSDGRGFDNSSLIPPASLSDLPMRVGSLFHLPWTGMDPSSSDKHHGSVYRLRTTSWNDEKAPPIPENMLLYSADVALLLKMSSPFPLGTVGISVHQQAPITLVAHDSPYLMDGWLSCTSVSELLLSEVRRRGPKSGSMLIHGATGSGKTHTALLKAAVDQIETGRSTVYFDSRRLKDTRGVQLTDIFEELGSVFGAAIQSSPCTLVLDDLDELSANLDLSQGETEHVQQINPALVDQCYAIDGMLRHLMHVVAASECDLSVVVTCRDADSLSSGIRSAIAVEHSVPLPLLSKGDRTDLFLSFIGHSQLSRRWHNDRVKSLLDGSDFGTKTAGFRPRDLEQLASRVRNLMSTAASDATSACPGTEIHGVTMGALEGYSPLSELSASAEQSSSVYGLSDVGGLFNVKRELATALIRPALYRRVYEKSKIRLPRGILLFGPPGCGKSFVVPALATDSGLPLIRCRGPELLDKYIGASERKVRELFARAASVAPSIVWIDEIDSLAPRRGSDNTGVTDRVVNQLLTFLDGVEENAGSVYTVATTSRPDKIDPALLRPGRLERHVYVGSPEEDDEWVDLLLKTAFRYRATADALEYIKSGQLLEELSEESRGNFYRLSAADVRSVFDSAQLVAAREVLQQSRRWQQQRDGAGVGNGNGHSGDVPGDWDDSAADTTLTAAAAPDTEQAAVVLHRRHLQSAFRTAEPSLPPKDEVELGRIYDGFVAVSKRRNPDDDDADTDHRRRLLRVALK